MSITIGEQDYYQLSKYLSLACDNVPAKGIWLALFNEYNVGTRQVDLITLTASNRAFIREKVKSLTGFDPVDDPAEKLAQRTRTQNSESGKNEKFISLKPREVFLEYRVLTSKTETQGYLGGDVEQVLAVNVNTVISIENFDTFVSVSYDFLSEAIDASEPMVVVYRGDNIASPKAVVAFRKAFKGTWFHFGDFDPQGINIGVKEMQANALILPTLESIKSNFILSQRDVYLRQNISLVESHVNTHLKRHLDLMKSNELAIMQEHICAHKLKLQIIQIR